MPWSTASAFGTGVSVGYVISMGPAISIRIFIGALVASIVGSVGAGAVAGVLTDGCGRLMNILSVGELCL